MKKLFTLFVFSFILVLSICLFDVMSVSAQYDTDDTQPIYYVTPSTGFNYLWNKDWFLDTTLTNTYVFKLAYVNQIYTNISKCVIYNSQQDADNLQFTGFVYSHGSTSDTQHWYYSNGHVYLYINQSIVNGFYGPSTTLDKFKGYMGGNRAVFTCLTNDDTSDWYNNGYNNGQSNLTDVEAIAYNNGYSVGHTIGHDLGYSEGVLANSSELNAISSIFPAVVGSIWGVLFDFLSISVFGISLWSIVMIFAGISVLLIIIKMLL